MNLLQPPKAVQRLAWAAICAGCLFVFPGCSVGPDYKSPSAPNVSDYTPSPLSPTVSSDVHGGGAQSFVKGKDIPGDWWTLFHSQELNQLIAEALKNSPTLEAAQATLNEARENVYAGEGSFFPSVSGTGRRSG